MPQQKLAARRAAPDARPARWLGRLVLGVALAAALLARPAQAQIGGSRYAAFVMDDATGEAIVSVNADEPRYPASLTKMMTLYMIFDAMQQGQISAATRIGVSQHAAGQEPSKLGLKAGSSITVRDVILALVTKSANDAAAAMAEHLGGSEVQFGRLMTRKAQELGMRNSSFRNASGLPDANQVTTARDMAILSRALIRHFPQRYGYFSARSFDWRGRTVTGHNRVLTEYDGADGLKTGFIRASGFNLAASAARDGVRIIAVVFGGATSRERDDHIMALMDRGFAERGAAPRDGMLMAERPAPMPAPRLVGAASAAAMAAPPLPFSAMAPPSLAASMARAAPALREPPRRVVSRAPAPAPRAAAGGEWSVQVGAFDAAAAARGAASRAARRGGKPEIEQVRSGGKTLYRARVAGLSATAARQFCRASSGPCLVISP